MSQLSLTLTGCPTPHCPQMAPPLWTNGSYKCTGGLYPANVGFSPTIPQGFPSVFRSDNGVMKIDYHINDHDTSEWYVFPKRGFNHGRGCHVSGAAVAVRTAKSASRGGSRMDLEPEFAMGEFSTLRFRTHEPDEPTGRFQRPTVNVWHFHWGDGHGFTTDYQDFRLQCTWGGPLAYRFGPDTVYQFVDYVSYVHGNHAFKFGGDFRRNLADPSQFGAAKGQIKFLGSPSLFHSGTSCKESHRLRRFSRGTRPETKSMGVCAFDTGRLACLTETDGQSRAAL